jgi:hypothetical protein
LCFGLDDRLDAFIEFVRLRRRISDGDHAEPSFLPDGRQHVQENARLAGLVEVQSMPDDDVEQIVGRERTIKARLQVVAGRIFWDVT